MQLILYIVDVATHWLLAILLNAENIPLKNVNYCFVTFRNLLYNLLTIIF